VAIGGGGKMAQFAGALGKCRNHRVSVGDGFVAGRLDAAGESFGWMYRAFLHARILAWACEAKNSPQRPQMPKFEEENLSAWTVLAAQLRARC
jgi:hypothetical protein